MALHWQRAIAGYHFAWDDRGRTSADAWTLFTVTTNEVEGPRGGKTRQWLLLDGHAEPTLHATLADAKRQALRIYRKDFSQ